MTEYPTLRLYSRNPEATRKLVELLAQRGYSVDSRTRARHVGRSLITAVKRFQAQHLDADGRPLAVDGVVGAKTWAALLRPLDDLQRTGLGRASRAPLAALAGPRIPIIPSPVKAHNRPYDLLTAALADYDAGRCEQPLGSNRCPWLEKRAQGLPWCSFQVHAWIKAVRGAFIFAGYRGSTRVDLKRAQALDLVVETPVPGDVFLLCRDGVPYHTGLVLRVGDSQIDTVEGNCANRVAVRRRSTIPRDGTSIVFWRPFAELIVWSPGLLPTPVKSAGGESTR